MSNKHDKNSGQSIRKKGLTVEIRPVFGVGPSAEKARTSAVEQALRTLKRRIIQEGVVRDMRKHEYHETKGQKRRRKFAEAVNRQRLKARETKEW